MRGWMHPRRFYLSDQLLQNLQDFADRADFAPRGVPCAEHFKAAGFDKLLRLAQKWRHWSLDAETLREIVFFPALSRPDRIAPTVSEQVVAALHILGGGAASHDAEEITDVVGHAQGVLSRHLVRFPVLMHPLMRLVMEDGGFTKPKRAVVSLTQAICVTLHGRFPLAEDGFTDDQLRAFYTHPCTVLGLFEKPFSRRDTPAPGNEILAQSPCDVLVEDVYKPLSPPLFASLYLAHKVLGSRAPEDRLAWAFHPDTLAAGRLAQAFRRSCKMRFGREHPAAIHALRDMGASSNPLFGALVAKSVVSDMFSEESHELDDGEYAARIQDILEKLCQIGTAGSIGGACQFLLQSIGHGRLDAEIAPALPRQALSFLQLLVDQGQVKLDPQAFSHPHWKAAAQSIANATAMYEAIHAEMHCATDVSHAPPRRVARMGM